MKRVIDTRLDTDRRLAYAGVGLAWDGVPLAALASRYGTPLYVVNRDELADAYRRMEAAFASPAYRTALFFSMKTNPVPAVVEAVAGMGAGAEVVSRHELDLALRLGLDGERILVNGGVKPDALLEAAVAAGVGLVNVESLDELQRLDRIAGALGRRQAVGLRVNPGLKRRPWDVTLGSSRRRSPSGFALDGFEWPEALALLAESDHLIARGLHMHLGSGIRSAAPYREALQTVRAPWMQLFGHALHPDMLDIGGGFGDACVKTYGLTELARMMAWGIAPKPPAAGDAGALFAEVAAVCASWVSDLPPEARPRTLALEPGRALSARAQLLLLTVEAVRPPAGGRRVALCDAGAMSLSPLLWSEYHTVADVGAPGDRAAQRYDILGNMPAPQDMVAVGRSLPELRPGSVLAVLDVGAYFTSFGNHFAGPLPAIVLIDAGVPRLIRRRETDDELFARDLAVERPVATS